MLHPNKILCLLFCLITLACFSQKQPTLSAARPDTSLINILLAQSKEKFQTDSSEAVRLALEAKKLSEQIGYQPGIAYAFKNLGIISYLQGRFILALENYKQALTIFEQLDDKRGSSNILSNIGALYYDKGNDSTALAYHLKSLKLCEQIGDKLRISTSYCNIGAVYANKKVTYDKALYNYHLALKIAREINDKALIGTTCVNMGNLFFGKNQDDSALIYFRESLKTYENEEDKPYTLNNMGKLYARKQQFDSALAFQQKAYDISSKTSNKLDMIISLSSMAETYLLLGNKKEALDKYQHALVLAKELDANNELKAIYEGLSKIYAQNGEYDNAYKYYLLFSNVKDALNNEEANTKIASLQFDYDLQKKESQINSLTQQKQISENKLKKERAYKYGLIIGLLLVLTIGIIQWRNNHLRQIANRLLLIQKNKTEIQKEKAERTLEELKKTQAQLIQSEKLASLGQLTAGISHEIQNPLNFINNFSELNTELIKELQEKLQAGQSDEANLLSNDIADNEQKIIMHGKRAESIIKRMLQHSPAHIGAKEVVDVNKLTDTYIQLALHSQHNKTTTVNIEKNFSIHTGKASLIPQDIGSVLLNLLNNAFYAVKEKAEKFPADFQPAIIISTNKNHNNIHITVEDNGTGISPENIKKVFQPFFTTKPTGQGTGLGLSLSYDIITKGHGGELKVETEEGKFSRFIITLPV